jgi:hypothetical protein
MPLLFIVIAIDATTSQSINTIGFLLVTAIVIGIAIAIAIAITIAPAYRVPLPFLLPHLG